MDIYTYTRHTHKYKVNTYILYNGVKEKDNTKRVRTRIHINNATGRHSQQQQERERKISGTTTAVATTCNKGKKEWDSNNSSEWGQRRGM